MEGWKKNYCKWLIILVVALFGSMPASAQFGDLTDDEKERLRVYFKESKSKITYWGLMQTGIGEEAVILICKAFSLPITIGKIADKENPIIISNRDQAINGFAPVSNRDGDEFESEWEQEMGRDVEQYVQYIEAALKYGLNMLDKDKEVKDHLIPERKIDENGELVETEVDDATFNGMSFEEFRLNMVGTMNYLEIMEFSGDDEQDLEMVYTFISETMNFEEEDGDAVESMNELIELLTSLDYSGDAQEDQDLVDNALQEYFDREAEEEVEEAEEAEETVYEPATTGTYEGSEMGANELFSLLGQLGVASRDVSERYGDAATPWYGEMKGESQRSNGYAIKVLTKFFEAWNFEQEKGYAETYEQMKEAAEEILNSNGGGLLNNIQTPPYVGN